MTYTVMPASTPWRSWLPEDDEDGPFPMTLIGALHCGDSILIGADSAGADRVDNFRYSSIHKLHLVEQWEPPLVWASAGDGLVASQFREWIDSYSPTSQWAPFIAEARRAVRSIMAHRRQQAIEDKRPNPSVAFVITGCIGGNLKIASADASGNFAMSVARDQMVFEGQGRPNAKMACLLLGHLQGKDAIETEEDWRFVMDLVADVTPDCQLPVLYKRVTRDSVTDEPS